jgi:hypothetical protein
MRTYRELVQRIRWYAKALITRYAVVRAVAVACTIPFAVAACSAGAAGTSTSGTGSPAAATTVTSSGPPSSSPASPSAAAKPADSATTAPASAPVITPGHSTPEGAVKGLMEGELTNNWTQACSYIMPSTQPTCNQAALQRELPTFTGNATVDSATISGSEALVAVTGSMCSSTSGCVSNSDPSVGMPDSEVTFNQAYDQVLNTGNGSLSPVPCIEENGMWYINATL